MAEAVHYYKKIKTKTIESEMMALHFRESPCPYDLEEK